MNSVTLKNAALAAIKTELDGGFMKLLSGAVPATADAVDAGTVIALVSVGDDGVTGFTFQAPSGGVLNKTAAEDWLGTILANGTITHYRLYEAGDDGVSVTTTKSRIQGTVGLAGADLNLSKVAVTTADDPVSVGAYFVNAN